MTQAAPNSRAADVATAPTGQPFGFASPKAPPLGEIAEPPGPPEIDATPPPDGYAPPGDPVPPLESIAPAPAETRDPRQPMLDAPPEVGEPDWQPTQPLPLSAASTALEAPGAAAGPSRNGSELDAPALDELPPPAGPPVGVPHQPYPVNPYATGPYSGYPPPQRPVPQGHAMPGRPAGQPDGPRRARQQPGPVTFQTVLQACDIWVLTALLLGMLWPQLAPYAIVVAAVVAIVKSSEGRVLVVVAAGVSIFISLIWYVGFLATSQWQSTAQLLCTVCLVGVPLVAYQSLRRWS